MPLPPLAPAPTPGPSSVSAATALSRTLQAGALLVAATLLVLVLEPLQLTPDSSSQPQAVAHVTAKASHPPRVLPARPMQNGKGRPVPPPKRGANRGTAKSTARAQANGKPVRTKGRPRRKTQPQEGVTDPLLAPLSAQGKGLPRHIFQRGRNKAGARPEARAGPPTGVRAGSAADAWQEAEGSAAEAPTMPPIPSEWDALSGNGAKGALSDVQYESRPEATLELEDLSLAPAKAPVAGGMAGSWAGHSMPPISHKGLSSRGNVSQSSPMRIPMRPPRPWNVSEREWDERKWEEPVPVQNISELLQRVDWYERRYSWAERGGNPKAPPLNGLTWGPDKGSRGKGSGSDLVSDVFGTGRKYYWVIGGGDKCAGESHFSWSFTCVAAEARMLNRTFVLDLELCLHPVHNFGKMVINPLAAYYNVEHMVTRQPMIALPLFTLALDQQLRTPGAPNVSFKAYGWTQKVEQVQHEDATLLVRDVGLNGYAYRICDYRGHVIHRDWRLLGHANALWSIVNYIAGSMGWDFDAVHIRRGDKLDPSRWPHLDFDTQPAQLLKKLPQFIRPGRRIYVSTNERTPGFFAPLERKYRVHMLGQYQHMWSNHSGWYNWSRSLLKDSQGFDVRMQAIVDYRVFRFARTKVETFNDLTDDPKHGI